MPDLDAEAPVVVGALGGSGTRVIGQLLIGLGVHIGAHLNDADDSLTASLLFNRPGDEADRAERVARFERIGRLLRGDAGPADRVAVLRAIFGVSHPPLRYRVRYGFGAVRERGAPDDATGWGFKEPNTHLYLDELADAFPHMRYVYVMRHPLDMAFSANVQQLHNWAPRFNIEIPDDPASIPVAQLDLWLAATDRATSLGPTLLGDRFWALDYEQLVENPVDGVTRLVALTGSATTSDRVGALAAMIDRPPTMGRYRREDVTRFRDDQLESIGRFGFDV